MNSPQRPHEARLRGLDGMERAEGEAHVAGFASAGGAHGAGREIPPLHLVTDDEIVARPGFLDAAGAVLAAGGADVALHLRAPHASGRRLHELADRLAPIVSSERTTLIVNDRADVALAANADGVQVGARGLRPQDARRLIGGDRLLGVSVHSVDEGRDALAGAPDFLLAGTIWETASHPGMRAAGIELIRALAVLGVPVIAIGGVTPARARLAVEAGATGVAAMRGVWDARDPSAAVEEYLGKGVSR